MTDSKVTEEIFSLFNRLALRSKEHQVACLERVHLTALEANALWRLEPGRTLSVRALAERCHVDPSNLSAPLERLDERGLVERRQPAHDARIRGVRLTAQGRAMRTRLVDCLFDAPPVVAGLSDAERATLKRLLSKLVDR